MQHKCVTHTRPRHVGRVRRAAVIFVTHIDGVVNNTADKLSLQVITTDGAPTKSEREYSFSLM